MKYANWEKTNNLKNVPTVATTKQTKFVIVQTTQRVGALVVAHEPHTSLRSVCMRGNYPPLSRLSHKLDVGEVRFFHPL